MSLRTRLILAFFFLSVVPLTAITLYSYRNSERALRQAAEVEGRQAAAEMSKRMEVVTASLSEQLGAVTDLPVAPRSDSPHDRQRTLEQVARALGGAAALLDRVEFVPQAPPAPPPPPAPAPSATPKVAPPAAAPPVPRVAPAPSVPPRVGAGRVESSVATRPDPSRRDAAARGRATTRKGDAVAERQAAVRQSAVEQKIEAGIEREAERVAVDVTGAIEEALKQYQGAGKDGQPPPAWVAPLVRSLTQGLQAGASITAQGLRIGAREIALRAQQDAIARELKLGGEWGIPVRREGKVVGTLNAKLNVERVLGTVFGLARVDQGELPFAIDESGRLFTPVKDKKGTLESLGVGQVRGDAGTTRVDSREDWLVVSRRDPSGMTFGLARPLGESLKALRRTTVQNLMLGLAVVGIAFIGIVPLSHGMTRKLGQLVAGARALSVGKFDHKVPIDSKDEIGDVARAFNAMATSIQAHQKTTIEQERLKQELDLCRRIQAEMLPHGPMNLGFGEVKGVSIPAREVGGDFFNYFALDDGKVALLVGDVSGKGVGAALLMANVQATLRARLPLEQDLARLVDAVDRDVDERTPGGVYFTLFIGILDPRMRRLRYVNAGHHPQFVLRRNGALERMPSAGLPVGLFAGHGYREQEATLEGGDLLFFYTDGTIETENETGEMFGIERLEALLESQHEYDTVLERVESALRDFRGKAELFDDATMMALRVDVPDLVSLAADARQDARAPAR